MRVVVVGAGIVGLATGYHLAYRGAGVTVLDAHGLAKRTSRVSFAWINANGKSPEHYFELNCAGMAEHADLARKQPGVGWLHRGGSLEWADTEAGRVQLERRAAGMAASGYPVKRLTMTEARELEPDVAAFHGPTGAEAASVVHFPTEGWVDTTHLAEFLASGIRDSGGAVLPDTAVLALEDTGAALAVQAHDQRWEAEVVVNAAGPDAGRIAALMGQPLATAGPLGMTCVTGPLATRISRVIRAPGVHFRPESSGLMLSSPAADAEVAAGRDPSSAAGHLLALAAQHVPTLSGAQIHDVRTGRRAVPPDGLPAIGSRSSAPRLYHAVMHSGITLAPLVGRLIAEELLSGMPNPRLEPYRPARFTA